MTHVLSEAALYGHCYLPLSRIIYYQGRPGEIEFEDLLTQRQEFTPAMERESEQIQAIRNQAIYAKPVASLDISQFAYQHRELFG